MSATRQCNSFLVITTTTENLQQTKEKEKNLPELNTLSHQTKTQFFKTGKGWEGGKSFYTVWEETKTESREQHEN